MKKSNKPTLFGKGTIAMLVGIATFALYSSWTSAPSPGTVYLQADKHGRLTQVDQASTLQRALPPLCKPEPGLILSYGDELGLNPAQRTSLQTISKSWKTKKSELTKEIDREVELTRLDKTHPVSMVDVQSNLQDYSELSRTYDHIRNSYWAQATNVLSLHQRSALGRVLPKGAAL